MTIQDRIRIERGTGRRPGRRTEATNELVVDRIACDGFGMCAELLPELIELDDWGYPIVAAGGVPDALLDHARRAVAVCPVLALRLARVPTAPVERGVAGWHGTAPRSVRR
jgi:ferredoxin